MHDILFYDKLVS